MTLKEARLARKLTQVQLAAKSGITQTYISAIECGDVKSPSWETVAKLSKALRCKPQDIFPIELERAAHS